MIINGIDYFLSSDGKSAYYITNDGLRININSKSKDSLIITKLQNQVTSIKDKNKSLITNIQKPDKIKQLNIEKLPDTKDLKSNIDKDKEKNKKEVEEAMPKLILKIPKPFAKGYFIVDIGGFLKGLLGSLLSMLSALLIGLLMSKLSELLGGLLADLASQKGNISSTDITNSLNSINMSDVMNELIDQENLMNLNKMLSDSGVTTGTTASEIIYNVQNEIDNTGTYSNDSITIDGIVQPSLPKVIKKGNQKELYTFNKRGRTDLLGSDEVSNRLNDNNSSRRTIDNPNYGKYW